MSRADICLILEGNYPYTQNGLSKWVHHLIEAHQDKSFHLLTLSGKHQDLSTRFQLPNNVVSHLDITLGELPEGVRKPKGATQLLHKLQPPLTRLLGRGGLEDLREVLDIIRPVRHQLGSQFLLNSRQVWEMLRVMYESSMPNSSFIDYFWSWRSLVSAIFSVLLFDLPEAGAYHSISTGYAGLALARAGLETGRPTLLSEHGLYLVERSIEISMADWLFEIKSNNLTQDSISHQLRELWIDTFTSFSQACYTGASEIIALYEEHQSFQVQSQAPGERIRLIPNGVDVANLDKAYPSRDASPLTVALIARVVPVKDVITFIRSAVILRELLPGIRIWVLGSLEEDVQYAAECEALVESLELQRNLSFKGNVDIREYLGQIHVAVLTSISESQPLALLEAGATGIPCVATDVGACREIIMGGFRENPPLGPAGEVTPLASPDVTANAIYHLLEDQAWYDRCSETIKKRVKLYYNQKTLDRTYGSLYDHYLGLPDNPDGAGGFRRWLG